MGLLVDVVPLVDGEVVLVVEVVGGVVLLLAAGAVVELAGVEPSSGLQPARTRDRVKTRITTPTTQVHP